MYPLIRIPYLLIGVKMMAAGVLRGAGSVGTFITSP